MHPIPSPGKVASNALRSSGRMGLCNTFIHRYTHCELFRNSTRCLLQYRGTTAKLLRASPSTICYRLLVLIYIIYDPLGLAYHIKGTSPRPSPPMIMFSVYHGCRSDVTPDLVRLRHRADSMQQRQGRLGQGQGIMVFAFGWAALQVGPSGRPRPTVTWWWTHQATGSTQQRHR